MSDDKQPTFGNGKICYMEIPTTDIVVSAKFYETVFGWNIRYRENGGVSFDDGVGEVSGMWVLGRKPADVIGLMISIMVDDIQASIELIKTNGGRIIEEHVGDSENIASFYDPAGNIFGLYQHRQ